jgi:antitoxin VapB
VDVKELRIRKRGNAIILEPVPDPWAWLDKLQGPLDEDVIAAINEEVEMPPDRPEVDKLFR